MGLSGTLLDFLGRIPGTLSELTWATRYARTRGGQNSVFMRRRMVYVQVSGHSDGLGSAFCKPPTPADCGSGWGDRRVGLGVTMGARFARQGSALLVCAGFCVRSPNVQAYPVDAVPWDPWRGASLGGGPQAGEERGSNVCSDARGLPGQG
jgi:hypothetical protein